jgi:GPI mannosyltransferase 3
LTHSISSHVRVWHVLALAFGARFALGLANDGVLYPDETMQYLEQAHRLVFGAGMVPWEYEYGVRPWIVPLVLGVPMRMLSLVGLDRPAVYQPAVEALLCAVSLTIPYAAFRIATAISGEHAGRFALVFTAFWYELVSYGHRATIDAIVAYAAFGALALAFVRPALATVIGCGVLIGLAFVLRFQTGPALAVIAVVAIVRWRERAAVAAAACALTVVAGGALDYYTWGLWFSAIRTSLELNAVGDLSWIFGVQPFYWYGVVLLVLSGGLVLAGAAGLALTWRSSWPLIAVALATLVGFSLIGHKQTRFVFAVTPVWLIGLAILAADRGRVVAEHLPALRRLAPAVAAAAVGSFAIISALGLFDRLPLERRYLRPNIARNTAREAYRALATHDDVVAVLDASGWSGWYLTPYYDLHHDVPLYWPLSRGYEQAMAQPARYASHVIAPGGSAPPAGFRELERIGGLTIWRRSVDPPSTGEVLGYERRIHALQPVQTLPRVTPRW